MRFYKYQGAGNDFVLLDNRSGEILPQELSALAKRLCARKYSVGADGMIVVEAPEHGGDCKMRFFNSDGSTAEMCGNGARCLSRFCHDFGLSGEAQKMETPAGMVIGSRISDGQYRVRLNTPSNVKLQMKAAGIVCDYMELGEGGIPHAVVETDLTQKRATLRDFARLLRHAPEFPRGANVNLWQQMGENAIQLLTFERGVEDFTLACGTGTGSTAAALTLRGLLDGEQTRVQCEGGLLTVDAVLDAEKTAVTDLYLTGGAELVFIGELPI